MTITKEVAAQFLKNPHSVNLSKYTSIEDAAAKLLVKVEGCDWLRLNGLTTLNDKAAQVLGRYEGELSLDGLTTISDRAAQELGRHEGDLSLDRLTTLSDGAAQALGQHKGGLSLLSVTSLSNAAVQALASHKGEVFLGNTTIEKLLARPLKRLKASAKAPDAIGARILKVLKGAPQGLLLREISEATELPYASVVFWLQDNCSKVRTEGVRKAKRVFLE
jgi:hypothetical protein